MKKTLRGQCLARRESLSGKEAREKSGAIRELLFSMPEFRNAKHILFYVSFRREVDTHQMIAAAILLGKKVSVPLSDPVLRTIVPSLIHNFRKDLTPNIFKILEPTPETFRPVPVKALDLVIAPGVGFDKKGGRIGYGKGFYDRFLKNVPKHVPVIGLAFECQVVDELPREAHDCDMHKLITEKEVVDCKA